MPTLEFWQALTQLVYVVAVCGLTLTAAHLVRVIKEIMS